MSSNRKLIIFVEIFSNFILLPETFVWFSCVHKKYLSLFLQDYPSCFPTNCGFVLHNWTFKMPNVL